MGRDKNEGDLDVNINEGGPYSDAGVGPNQDTTSFDHRRNTPEPAYLVEEEPNARPASGEETIGIETSPLPKEMLSRAELGRQGRTIQPTKTSTSRLTPMTCMWLMCRWNGWLRVP